MHETATDHWFYSREGERLGPVTLGDLRVKAKDGGLNPRLDMVWTQGMAGWKLAGEVDGLFERTTAFDSKQIPSIPTHSPQSSLPSFTTERQANPSEWPGARRLIFFFATGVLPFLLTRGVKNALDAFPEQFGSELSGFIVIGAMVLTAILMIHVSLQRLVNLGMSRWWFLGNFIPLLNLWVGFRCFACPSGYAYHKKLDGIGILLAILYFITLIIAVLAIAAGVAVLLNFIGTPEIRQQLEEAIHTATAGKL